MAFGQPRIEYKNNAQMRKMHEADIDHPDLNIGNILARLESSRGDARGGPPEAEAFIVDWDRARLRSPGSWNPHRNLFRLWRSVLKLARFAGPSGSPDAAAVRSFLRGYFGQNREGLRALRGYVKPRRVLLAFHNAFCNMRRPRWSRERTVPTGHSSTSAISWYEASLMK